MDLIPLDSPSNHLSNGVWFINFYLHITFVWKFLLKLTFNKPRPQLRRGSMINQQHSQYTSKKIEKIYILHIDASTSKWCFHFCNICKQSRPFASAHTGVQNAPKIFIGRFRKFVINIIFGEKNKKKYVSTSAFSLDHVPIFHFFKLLI